MPAQTHRARRTTDAYERRQTIDGTCVAYGYLTPKLVVTVMITGTGTLLSNVGE